MGTLQLQLFSSTASILGILAGGWPERGSASSSLERDPGGAWAGLILRDRSCVSVWACTDHSGKLRTHQCAPPASHIHLHTSPLASSATPENMCVRLFIYTHTHTHTHTHTELLPQAKCAPGMWTSPGPSSAQPSILAIARDPGQQWGAGGMSSWTPTGTHCQAAKCICI